MGNSSIITVFPSTCSVLKPDAWKRYLIDPTQLQAKNNLTNMKGNSLYYTNDTLVEYFPKRNLNSQKSLSCKENKGKGYNNKFFFPVNQWSHHYIQLLLISSCLTDLEKKSKFRNASERIQGTNALKVNSESGNCLKHTVLTTSK